MCRDERCDMPGKAGVAAAPALMVRAAQEPDWLAKITARPAPAKLPPAQRKKLWELQTNLHCSVIGTCMPTPELRKLLQRFSADDLARMSELELHEQGVMAAGGRDDAARSLHKALDKRHEVILRKFSRAADTAAVRALWREARQGGDLPGAYWAVLTHSATDDGLVHEAFGDVHMLSHLVGAANRGALTRLAVLEEQRAELETRIEKQQARFQQLVAERDGLAQRIDELAVERVAARAEAGDTGTDDLVTALQQRLAAEIGRRERAEQKRDQTREQLTQLQRDFAATRERESSLRDEVGALESLLEAGSEPVQTAARVPLAAGSTVLYVGGRPAQVEQMRALLAAAGTELLDHDGGLQERVGMLAGMISRADLVVFPVDCISHGAMHAVKRLCGQAGKPYQALRSAGLASFLDGLARAPRQAPALAAA